MKSLGLRAILLSASLLAISDSGSRVFVKNGRAAVVYPVETGYVLPTSYALPAAYVLPRSYAYVAPTSYVVPTSYVYSPTSYAVPTVYATSYVSPAYAETSYLTPSYYLERRGLFGRRLVARPVYAETSYYTPTVYASSYYTPTVYASSYYTPTVYSSTYYTPTVYSSAYYPTVYSSSYSPASYVAPTSYVYPTLYDFPVVATTASPCGDTVAPARRAAPPATVSPDSGREPSSAVDTRRETVAPPKVEEPVAPPRPLESEPRTQENNDVPPNPRVPPQVSKEVPPVPPANTADALTPPVAPAGDAAGLLPLPTVPQELPPQKREARRPIYGTTPVRATRNVLTGKVVSGDTGNLEEGVQVIVSSQTNAFRDRVTTTNANGRYALRVPDGDWTVSVVMPSGRAYPVSRLTISGGEIVDDLGRDVPSLTITR